MAPQNAQKQATMRFKITADQPTTTRQVRRPDCASTAMWLLQCVVMQRRLLALLRRFEEQAVIGHDRGSPQRTCSQPATSLAKLSCKPVSPRSCSTCENRPVTS